MGFDKMSDQHLSNVTRICYNLVKYYSLVKRYLRHQKLKELSLNRGYSETMIISTIDNSILFPRDVALKREKAKHSKQPVFVVTKAPLLRS